MEIKFLGGAEEVGKLGMLLNDEGTNMLFDYGFNPDKPPQYPLPAPPVEHVFLTHAHVDHSGLMPVLSSRGSNIHGTDLTGIITKILSADSLKISRAEGYPEPFTDEAIDLFSQRFYDINYNERITIDGNDVDVFNAGHIPGAAMYLVNGSKTLLFTGDINNLKTDLVKSSDTPKADILVVEATYGGRNHPNRKDTEKFFLNTIDNVIEQGGKVVIPAFAVGRTQEILLTLCNTGYNIYLDGLGKKITQLYLQNPRYINNAKKLAKAVSNVNFVHNEHERGYVLKEADIIVTTSGMLDGGPVLFYVDKLKNDPLSAIMLTGFQVPKSNGRSLIEKGEIDLYGVKIKPHFKTYTFNFSAHIDHNGLIDFIQNVNPSKVVLMHSENREAIVDELNGQYEFFLPRKGETISL